MDEVLDGLQEVVAANPDAVEQPATAQPDDGAIETRLAREISELWSSHVRLSGDRKATSTELRQVRARLAERLHAMKSLLSRPGRGGQWRSWLRERRIPRSTADRLAARHAETLGSQDGNRPTEAISDPTLTAEKLATSVWLSLRKKLPTCESVVQFIGCLVTAAGVAHEWRTEGLMILNPTPRPADAVTGTGVSAEAACPAPLPPEGDGNPVDSPAADPAPQLLDEVSAATQEPSGVTPTPPEAGEAAAVVDEGGGYVA